METKIFKPTEVDQAARMLRRGELVSFPTETVYGLGAIVTDRAAVKDVYLAKGRPSDNPLIVHVASPQMVWQYAKPNTRAQKLMKHFWPGSLTLILPLQAGKLLPEVTGGLTTAAFRMPHNQTTLNLIKATGIPLVGPSANTSGKPSPTTAAHVYHDLHGKISGVMDDGPTQVGLESTVLDLSVDPAAILRPGAVTAAALKPYLGTIDTATHHVSAQEVPKAPGMKYKHYAPKAQVLIVPPEKNFLKAVQENLPTQKEVGVLAFERQLVTLPKQIEGKDVVSFSLGADLHSAAHKLFAGLRYFDLRPDIKVIIAAGVRAEDLGIAFMNRLQKAAGNQFVQ